MSIEGWGFRGFRNKKIRKPTNPPNKPGFLTDFCDATTKGQVEMNLLKRKWKIQRRKSIEKDS